MHFFFYYLISSLLLNSQRLFSRRELCGLKNNTQSFSFRKERFRADKERSEISRRITCARFPPCIERCVRELRNNVKTERHVKTVTRHSHNSLFFLFFFFLQYLWRIRQQSHALRILLHRRVRVAALFFPLHSWMHFLRARKRNPSITKITPTLASCILVYVHPYVYIPFSSSINSTSLGY